MSNKLESITPSIWRFQGQTYWGESVNCYLIEDDNRLLIIDSPNYNKTIVELVKSFNKPIEIFLTHAAASGDGHLWQEKENIKMSINSLDINNRWMRGRPAKVFTKDLQLSTHVLALHTPAHSPGHTMYYDNRDGGSLFSGDGILLHRGSWNFDLTSESIIRLQGLQFTRLLPNHYDLVLEEACAKVFNGLKKV